ncbi:MAG: site-specific tyrosine recombinase XerD [Bacteroidia bacterium]|nr:site-specific tyrosine recombinase XerD [Bacteroidia bacterium]
MDWRAYINGFGSYLKLEKSLSSNSVEAYLHDVDKLFQFLTLQSLDIMPDKVDLTLLQKFIKWVNELGMTATSQARMISGIKAFYRYLLMENIVKSDPTQLLEAPKLARKLPDVLTVEDINGIIDAVDLSSGQGQRNKAMLETLYSCGLRVSELVNLRISNLFLNENFVKVIGKGDKERLVPIGSVAIKQITIYKNELRCHIKPLKSCEDILFLNRRGGKLTRVMVFTIIKQLAHKTGLKKHISPHTFRHSFATHLIDGGADLRAVQEMLGHESITTTEIYTHLDRQYLRDAIIQFHPRS